MTLSRLALFHEKLIVVFPGEGKGPPRLPHMAVGYLPFANGPLSTTTTWPCAAGGLFGPVTVFAAFSPLITNQPSSALFFASRPFVNLVHRATCISTARSSALPD